jgi:5-oxopent-3-ene-1,2,5-tricarboxylate decarboxylase/2-hydroxyhepta-2,4-diene-1,7-dioate isomerase
MTIPNTVLPPSGCVYGAALNYRAALESLADVFSRPPHGRPPVAPVLYIKPRNTWSQHGQTVPLPDGVDAVEVGATFGVVIGRDARCVAADAVDDYITGYTLANDVTIPHASVFRPPLRYKCRDGFCPIGPHLVPRVAVRTPEALEIRAYVNGELRLRAGMGGLYRGVARLVSDVTGFMTLRAGDVLLLGVPPNPPLARAGDLMTIEADGFGRLENRLVPESDLESADSATAPGSATGAAR